MRKTKIGYAAIFGVIMAVITRTGQETQPVVFPISDIVSILNSPQLYDHVQDVLRKLISVQNQVSTLGGSWFLVRIMPYRLMDKRIDGVVITCNDITAAKKKEAALLEEIAQLKAQIAS